MMKQYFCRGLATYHEMKKFLIIINAANAFSNYDVRIQFLITEIDSIFTFA